MRDFLKGKNIGPMLLIVVLLLALSVGAAVYNGTLSAQHTSEEKTTTKEEADADTLKTEERTASSTGAGSASSTEAGTETGTASSTEVGAQVTDTAAATGAAVVEAAATVPHLEDKATLYENDVEDSVVTMYLTVRRGNQADNTDHSWADVNSYSAYDYEAMGVDRYQVEGLLQVGDENGPVAGELGFGESAPNATVQIRGQTSSKNAQKNYKIRLKDEHGSWRGQQTIALNKHMTDGLRYRNKLAFDLLKEIPQLISLRTQFVHLYVKDQTTDPANERFQDYGLYTQVEQLNKTALRAHGLDRYGQLYKVNSFEFYRHEDTIRLETDPDFDQKAFEKLLEIKVDHDHSKLIRMLEEINDYSMNADQLLADWLDEENIAYWMAFQILMGNTDTQNRNFYIYSPKNVDRFYILPWDFDGTLFYDQYALIGRSENSSWERGISNYWGNILFRRCLQSAHFRHVLDDAIEDLRTHVLTKEHLTSMAERYAAVVKSYVYQQPDIMNAPLTEAQYDTLTENIYRNVEEAYQSYRASLEKPMPFYIGVPEPDGQGKLRIVWDPAYDFREGTLVYHASIARNSDGTGVVASYDGAWPEWTTDLLPAGQYFLKVSVRDDVGHTQDAFDYYVTEDGKVYGTKCFYVNADGTISEDTVEEKDLG